MYEVDNNGPVESSSDLPLDQLFAGQYLRIRFKDHGVETFGLNGFAEAYRFCFGEDRI